MSNAVECTVRHSLTYALLRETKQHLAERDGYFETAPVFNEVVRRFCISKVAGMVITIDGPAGSGKSTVARLLAERLGYFFLATGAMYRAVAWRCLADQVPLSDAGRVAAAARSLRLRFEEDRLLADGQDITELVRTNEVSEAASVVAVIPAVREALVGLQRQVADGRNVVSEGRDQGTVVFPDAEHKFFVTADAEERARRRQAELKRQGETVDHQELLAQIRQRDLRDATREVAPLRPAPDALEIDTTGLPIEEVVTRLERHIRGC